MATDGHVLDIQVERQSRGLERFVAMEGVCPATCEKDVLGQESTVPAKQSGRTSINAQKCTHDITVTIHLLPINPAQPGVFCDWLCNTQSIQCFVSEQTRNHRLERFPNTDISGPLVFLVGDPQQNMFLLFAIERLENRELMRVIRPNHGTCHASGNHLVQDDAARKPIHATTHTSLTHR